MIKVNEMIQSALDFIEKESESWDEELLIDGDLTDLFSLIQEAVCKRFFMQMHKEMEDLLEESLKEESIYFYYDCLQFLMLLWLQDEKNNEIDVKEFYLMFLKFIQYMKEIKIKEGMGDEFKQLYNMLKKVTFDEGNIEKEIIKNRKFRYATNMEGEDVREVDNQKSTKRFWKKWIVGMKSQEITMKELQRKKMNRNELIFWLILVSVNNFADVFGDEETKKLKRSIANIKDTEKTDISKVLYWCFNCCRDLLFYQNDHLLEFMDMTLPSCISGLVTIINRFHYTFHMINGKIKSELIEFFEIPNKVSTTPDFSTALIKMRQLSLDTNFPLTGKMTSKEVLSSDNRFIIRYLKDIWKDFNNKWIEGKFEEHKKSDEITLDRVLYITNTQLNNFRLYGFFMLNSCQYYQMTNYFLAEAHLFFSQLDSMMFSGKLSKEDLKLALSILAYKDAGVELNFDDEYDEEDDDEYDEEDESSKILDKVYFDLQIYAEKSKNEREYAVTYWELVKLILKKKKIKISDDLADRLFSHQTVLDGFNITSDGYISWEEQPDNVVDEFFYINIVSHIIIKTYCYDLEYSV